MNRPAVFFDRDNTLIANDGYLGDPGKVVLIAGAPRAIARARALGYAVVTVSNQSGVARGMFGVDAIHRVNSRMDELLLDQHPNARIDRHEFCPYHPDATVERYKRDSELRKPKPGMILQAAERLNLDLERSWVVGDAPRDVEAGKAAGCRTILFTDPALKPSSATEAASAVAPDFVATSLQEALDIIEQNQMSKAKPEPASVPEGNNGDEATEPFAEQTPMAAIKEDAAPALVVEEVVTPQIEVEKEIESPAVEAAEIESKPEDSKPEEAKSQDGKPEVAEPEEAKSEEEMPEVEESSAPAASPVTAAPTRPRKMTFAERVKAGTFQPARSATAAAVPTADRQKRAVPAPGSESKPAIVSASDAEPGIKPTEPVSDSELLEPLLQQILEELRMMRAQHHPGTDFAVSKLLAAIVQVLVLPALFFAYLHRDSTGDLESMLLLATFLQTLTISLLIMGRQQ